MKSAQRATKPPRLSREQQRARTRAALCDAAARVFVERGFTASSVEAIAAEAGYSRGAFYANFASKEDLFVEVLDRRVYGYYRHLAEQGGEPDLRTLGERLAAVQRHPDGAWLFRLWLEVLAHADRDERLRKTVAGFWDRTRELGSATIARAYADAGERPPLPPGVIASAMIAMDVGLAVQHHVDADAVPLDVYPGVFETVFGPLQPK